MKIILQRGAPIFYPTNVITGILVAIIYCFIIWNLRNLGKFRLPLFAYAVGIQLAFLTLYTWMINSFEGDLNFANNYTNAFAISIMVFYFLMVVPFVIALGIHIYKGIKKLEITRTAKGIMITLFIVFSLTFSVTGFYLHVFFYFGFAP